MQIHIQNGEQRLGPLSLEEVNQSLAQHLISLDALAWYEGCPNWISLRQVPGLVLAPRDPHSPPPLSAAPSLPPPPAVPPRNEGDATGGIIPYKNPHALIAYYVSIFALIPVLGIVLAIPAIVLGVMGLKKKKLNPIIKGSVHAWIGIALGVISLGYNSLFIIGLIFAMSHRAG